MTTESTARVRYGYKILGKRGHVYRETTNTYLSLGHAESRALYYTKRLREKHPSRELTVVIKKQIEVTYELYIYSPEPEPVPTAETQS